MAEGELKGGKTGGEFTGFYLGRVRNVADPLGLGRIMVEVPEVSSLVLASWAPPFSSSWGIGEGVSCIPTMMAEVWVIFRGGDINFPYWMPGPTQLKQKPSLPAVPGTDRLETLSWIIEAVDGVSITITDKARMNSLTLTSAGVMALIATLQVQIGATTLTPLLDGVVTRQCVCSLTGAPHPDASIAVMARKV